MTTYNIDRMFPWNGRITPKVSAVMRMFGVDIDKLAESSPHHQSIIELSPGQICYITGPSGSGKSILLREIAAGAHEAGIDLDSIYLSDRSAVIDCIDGNFIAALKTLSVAGLSDVFTVLNRPAYLSEGQKYRFRLAKALSSCKRLIFADEFCSNLDRITAAVIAYQIRKFAARNNVAFVLASSHEDILPDLQPDVVVIKHLNGKTEVHYRHVHNNKTS